MTGAARPSDGAEAGPVRAPRVSIVVPVHNEEETIGPCLDAILRQTSPADEIIVVDNASTDATRARLAGYADRVVLLTEPRLGVLHARDRGLTAATGDVIGRIDADTRLPPYWVEAVRRLFADGTVAAVTGPVTYYDIRFPAALNAVDLVLRRAWALPSRQGLDWVFGANMAVRARAWHAVRGDLCDDRRYHEDLDLGIHLHRNGHRVVFAAKLRAGTSARRFRDRPADFWAYLRMIDASFASHSGRAGSASYWRACLTTRLIMLCYLPFRALHRSHPAYTAAPPRKNPMAAEPSP
ncbi:glycosyltransferase [Micromonospora sp. NBC_01796]|uniref:glycosyltransferase n=1 Tax=Micromonospora sp. NBC_01796 TaxID=2975987 RepID=UPI002DD9F786|nr:glycosyltransferase family A protein [Micromonospora sp. NBC_01796]WSA84118.1 glycosyltransferase family 2 protein [Micromonospora sp. NBC_01796]